MNSSLMLDKTDPEIAGAIAGWMDGQEYSLNVRVRQVSSDDMHTTFDVVGIEVEEAVAEELPEAMPGAMPARPAGVSKIAQSYSRAV